MKPRPLLIGTVAAHIGVRPEAIRYYERRGLIPSPGRAPNGYRVYSSQHMERVEFIKKTQSLGLTLDQIREIMDLKFSGASPCQHVRDLLRVKVTELERQIVRLKVFRREIAKSLRDCEKVLQLHAAPAGSCPVLERIKFERGKKKQ